MQKVIIGILITIVLVGGILVVDHSMRVNREASTQQAGGAGKSLPTDVEITNFSTHEKVTLNKFAGKVVLINFWASWCEACMAEMPSIEKLYEQLKGEGFEVIAVNVDENPSKVVPQVVSKLHLTFPIFTEANNDLSRTFDVVAIPFSVVADRKLKIVWAESGERDWASPAVIGDIRKLLKPI